MVLRIQEFLRGGGSFADLEERYGIASKPHSKYSNLVLFKYDQIASPFAEEIVRECRGIILNRDKDWSVVSFPFRKFFNYEEGHAAKIDWTTARVQAKEDGSLATVFVYDHQWHAATSGTADASGQVKDFGFTFEKLFWDTFKSYPKTALPHTNCGKCFFFELTSPYNTIVVRYKEPGLTLLGGRDLTTLQEMPLEEAQAFFPNIPAVRQFKLGSFDDIVSSYEKFSGAEQEGYVVCDGAFNRVKCKHPQYVALHHMKDGLNSRRSLIEVVRVGELDEVIAVFPEFKETLLEAKAKFDALVSELELAYEQFKDIKVQKEFAFEAVKTRVPGALFQLRSGKVKSIAEHLREIQIDNLIRYLGYKD
jgi:RNA ligase